MSKYKRWYDNIIYNAKNRIISGYVEVHHIIPRSLGGSDELENLVQLSAREHFICHILLTKFTTGQDKYKMLHAAISMKAKSVGQKRYINSRLYEYIRKEYSKAKKGVHNNSWNTGLTTKTSEKLRLVGKKISASVKGLKFWSNGEIEVKSKTCPGEGWLNKRLDNQNFKHSNESKLRIKQRMSNGAMSWWNNGIINKRQSIKPVGDDWVQGRLKSSMSKHFNGKESARKYDYIILENIITNENIRLCNIDKEFKDFCKIERLSNIVSAGKCRNFRVKEVILNPKFNIISS